MNHTFDKKTFDSYIQQRGILDFDDAAAFIYHKFVEIPLQERHFAFSFARNENDIELLKQRIIDCRKWMNENLFKITPN